MKRAQTRFHYRPILASAIVLVAVASCLVLALNSRERRIVHVATTLSREDAGLLTKVVAEKAFLPGGTRIELECLPPSAAWPLKGKRGGLSSYDLLVMSPSAVRADPKAALVALGQSTGTADAASLFPAAFGPLMATEGKPSMLPLYWSPCGLYYNKSVLAAAGLALPGSLEDFLSSAALLKEKGGIPLAIGGAESGRLFDLLAQLDASLQGPDIHSRVRSGAARVSQASIEAWYGIFRKGFTQAAPESFRDPDAAGLLLSGKAAFLFAPMAVHTSIPVEMEPAIGYMPFPAFAGRTSYALVGELACAALTERGNLKPPAKGLFAAFLRPEVQEALVLAQGPRFRSIPALSAASFTNLEGRTAAIALAGSQRAFEAASGGFPQGKRLALDDILARLSRAASAKADPGLVEDLGRALGH